MNPNSNKSTESELDLSVIIPLYNERENLAHLEEKLCNALSSLGKSHEIIMVDDGSLDGGAEVIRNLQKSSPHLRLIRLKKNQGQSAAFAAGFRIARGRVFVTLDADLQNDPADIPILLEKIDEFDMICGWRHDRKDSWVRRCSSKIANAVRKKFTADGVSDTGCSLKAFRRECFENITYFKGMHRFFPTLMQIGGFKIAEVKVNHFPRYQGKSKYNIRNRLFSSFCDLLAIRWLKSRHIDFNLIEED